MAELRQSLTLREQLSERNPKNSGARGEIAEAAAALGDALAQDGQRQDALAQYERALAIYSELRSRGSLTAELGDEPARIEVSLRALKSR